LRVGGRSLEVVSVKFRTFELGWWGRGKVWAGCEYGGLGARG
jgi:hypothetical protein